MTKTTSALAAGLLSISLMACSPAAPGSSGSGGRPSSGSGGSSGSSSGGSNGSMCSTTGSGGQNGSGNGSPMSCSNSTTIMATEDHDYKFSSTLTLEPIAVKPKSVLHFKWGSVTKDFIGHPVDAKKDLTTILMFLWRLNRDDLQTKLNNDELRGTDLVSGAPLTLPADCNNTEADLTSFKLGGGMDLTLDMVLDRLDPDKYPPDKNTYTLMAQTGTELGRGVRMIQAFKLDNSSNNTTVELKNDSTGLQKTVDMHSSQMTEVPSGDACIKLDWEKLPKNALGVDFDNTSITEVMVGHYDESPTDLEGDKFLDLDRIAKDLYRGNIDSGFVADFSKLKNSSGDYFKGIDNTGTWLVALICGNCRNPAPLYLSVLKAK
ncbi:MAG TPA: hypothetical protein VIU64_14070 [Polyangia bacterium]